MSQRQKTLQRRAFFGKLGLSISVPLVSSLLAACREPAKAGRPGLVELAAIVAPPPVVPDPPPAPAISVKQAAPVRPSYPSTLTLALAGDLPSGLDLANVDDVLAEQLNRMVFETLVRFTPRFEIVPHLAERYEVAADGLSWTFALRPGLRFHDGSPLDAAAVKASFDRLLGPERPLHASLFDGLVREVLAIDASTLRFVLRRPSAFFLNALAHDGAAVVNQTAVQKLGAGIRQSAAGAGSGPFRFVELVPGDRWVAVANDRYWGGRPRLDRVVARFIPEPAARASILAADGVQAAQRPPFATFAGLSQSGQLRLVPVPGTRVLGFGLNNLKPPFNRLAVRQALQFALDRPALVAAAFGSTPGGEPLAAAAAGPVANLLPGFAELAALPYDPNRARALLSSAGLAAGFTCTLWTTRGRFPGDFELAQALQQQLGKLSIIVKIETFDWPALLRATAQPIEENRADIFLLARSSTISDAQAALQPFAGGRSGWPPRGENRCFYASPEFDQLLTRATQAADRPSREAALRQAQELLAEDAPAIFLAAPREVVALSSRLSALQTPPTGHIYADEKTELA